MNSKRPWKPNIWSCHCLKSIDSILTLDLSIWSVCITFSTSQEIPQQISKLCCRYALCSTCHNHSQKQLSSRPIFSLAGCSLVRQWRSKPSEPHQSLKQHRKSTREQNIHKNHHLPCIKIIKCVQTQWAASHASRRISRNPNFVRREPCLTLCERLEGVKKSFQAPCLWL